MTALGMFFMWGAGSCNSPRLSLFFLVLAAIRISLSKCVESCRFSQAVSGHSQSSDEPGVMRLKCAMSLPFLLGKCLNRLSQSRFGYKIAVVSCLHNFHCMLWPILVLCLNAVTDNDLDSIVSAQPYTILLPSV